MRRILQHLEHSAGKLVAWDRLGEEIHVCVQYTAVGNVVRGVPGHEEAFHLGAPFGELLGKAAAVHVGQNDVGE